MCSILCICYLNKGMFNIINLYNTSNTADHIPYQEWRVYKLICTDISHVCTFLITLFIIQLSMISIYIGSEAHTSIRLRAHLRRVSVQRSSDCTAPIRRLLNCASMKICWPLDIGIVENCQIIQLLPILPDSITWLWRLHVCLTGAQHPKNVHRRIQSHFCVLY